MNQTIIQAIQGKQVIELRYHGYSRIVEPHAHGINHKNHQLLRCYQVSGGSVSGESPGWKLLLLSDIQAMIVTDRRFVMPRPGYKRGDSAMNRIFGEI